MKNRIVIALFALCVLAVTQTSHADRYQRAQNDNPFRLVAYVLHPIGIAAEYVVMRPVHWVVSQPQLDVVFGHQSHVRDDGTYFEWNHGDYSPSIAAERNARAGGSNEGYQSSEKAEMEMKEAEKKRMAEQKKAAEMEKAEKEKMKAAEEKKAAEKAESEKQ